MAANTGTAWTQEEDAIVRDNFPDYGSKGIHGRGLLRHRTQKAIENRASAMGVERIMDRGWGVPVHFYAPEDRAMREWDYPVDPGEIRYTITPRGLGMLNGR